MNVELTKEHASIVYYLLNQERNKILDPDDDLGKDYEFADMEADRLLEIMNKFNK